MLLEFRPKIHVGFLNIVYQTNEIFDPFSLPIFYFDHLTF